MKAPGHTRRVLLCVTGGVAAYKAVSLARALQRRGCEVRVALTANAIRFITPTTFRSVTRTEPAVDLFPKRRAADTTHISLSDWADAVLVAPATANCLGKVAAGIADDLVSTLLLASPTTRVVFAPAMNTRMWEHPSVRDAVARLESMGCTLAGPGTGELACGDQGTGRLADEVVILDAVERVLSPANGALSGVRVVVTAGGTREPLDPMRFIGNRSSGRQGHAVAEALARRGADVTLITTAAEAPRGLRVVRVETAADMARAVRKAFTRCRVLVMAAAVADFTFAHPQTNKHKKNGKAWTLRLVPTEDILGVLGPRKGRRIVVGFAAETDNLLANAKAKLERKGCDLLVANPVGIRHLGPGAARNRAWILDAQGGRIDTGIRSKEAVARILVDQIEALLVKRNA